MKPYGSVTKYRSGAYGAGFGQVYTAASVSGA